MRQESGRFTGKGFDFVLRHIPKKAAYPVAAAVGIIGGIACGSSGNNPEPSTIPTTGNTISTSSETPLDTSFSSSTLTNPPTPSPTSSLQNSDVAIDESAFYDNPIRVIPLDGPAISLKEFMLGMIRQMEF